MIKADWNEPLSTATAPGRIIAIGDIHGCARALTTLLEAISPGLDDLIIPLGDVIDCGPDSRGVIDTLIQLSSECRLAPVMGNHEEMMLAAVRDGREPERWFRFGGAATLESYGFRGGLDCIPQEHVDFLATFANYQETAEHFFVHGNYAAQTPLAEQRRRGCAGPRSRSISLSRIIPASRRLWGTQPTQRES